RLHKIEYVVGDQGKVTHLCLGEHLADRWRGFGNQVRSVRGDFDLVGQRPNLKGKVIPRRVTGAELHIIKDVRLETRQFRAQFVYSWQETGNVISAGFVRYCGRRDSGLNVRCGY